MALIIILILMEVCWLDLIVEQRNSAAAEYDYMVSGRSQTPATGNDLLQIGYRENAILTWGQFDNDYDITVAGYNSPIPRIHALVFSSTATSPKVYFINGARQTLINNGTPVASQPLVAYENANFGSYDGLGYYQGNIGEIIIFNRGLKNEERRSIEEYLGKKWKIEISN
jgi:hypothetical protein